MATIKIIKTNTGSLKRDSEKVKRYIDEIDAELDKMENSVRQLDKMWEGKSSEAFKRAFHDDIQAAETMIENLNKIYKFEVTAHNKYESCEKEVGNMISSIKV